jgi:hypothetical protein
MFTETDPMPVIWTIYNDMKFAFVLVPPYDTISEKENYFMIVMQRFLQDICRNIIICPSDVFFSNFSPEHSFHGKPHRAKRYQQKEWEQTDIQPPQKIKLDDESISKILFIGKCQNILMTNNTTNTYYFQKIFEEPSQSTINDKFDKLKESLQILIDINNLNVGQVLKLCQHWKIFLSKNQQSRIENIVSEYVTEYDKEKSMVSKHAKSLVKELLNIENKIIAYFNGIDVGEKLKNQIIEEVISWLINPVHIDETVQQFSSRLTTIVYHPKLNQNASVNIECHRLERFKSELQPYDKKKAMRVAQKSFIHKIRLAVTSENQFEARYNIERLHYNPKIDTKNHLQCLAVVCYTPIQMSLNDLSFFINISDLSELERLDFSRRIEVIACFNMNDGISELIVVKRPEIISKKMTSLFIHTLLLHKSGTFRKLMDFQLSFIQTAYSSNQNSNTLVLYQIYNGSVTKCLLDDFGQLQKNFVLHLQDRSKKPTGIKSLALTVAQNLLIIIDFTSNVYEIDISKEDVANISLLFKNAHDPSNKRDFTADNNDLYEAVATIGEKNPVFFFQAKSCVDIIDQNYCQMYSIKLEQHSPLYKMQIFTDFIDAYCVLLSANDNEVYYIQNLVSDTRIERQESSTNLDKSTKQYVGNRLLDIIKQGEMQFGVTDLSDKTQYHFILSSEHSAYSDRIKKYFEDLNVKAQLKIGYEERDLIYSSLDIEKLIKAVVTRVPLQLCTIEMGAIVPLNNGRRDKVDHLSSTSFRIEMKAREISFSYLDDILNNINDNIKIVGIIGRQSTGKSYLMNKLFRTRFAVAAGRCTDGIWMSYAYIDNTHFIVLDCEGLFSDQRTEDEEIKLISFLAAVCDITILSQDLGFSRFQDRLFNVLSQAVNKIGKNDKLFKGILLVAVRDIGDSNADESSDAAEKKFLQLQKKGKSQFLEQLFSKRFTVQLLHHFEDKNFDYEIVNLRQIFLEHFMKDEVTDSPLPCRWENGKDLADRLKILLIQLYTDDFTDSNDIHTDFKLIELEKDTKRAWTTFCLDDENNIQSYEQEIKKEFDGKLYLFKLNHTKLELDENSLNNNFDRVCEFILNQLRSAIIFSDKTNEEKNKIYLFINDVILEAMDYRRQQVKQLMLERFQKQFPSENENVKERKTNFMSLIEQYMLSHNLQICLKKCSSCDLKCINSVQHTEITKTLLKERKDELTRLQASLPTIPTENIEQRVKNLKECHLAAKAKEDNLHKEKVRLTAELNNLFEKENLIENITRSEADLAAENTKLHNLEQKIVENEQQLKHLLSLENELTNIGELSRHLDDNVKQLMNADQYKIDHLKELIEKFQEGDETDYSYKNVLLCFSPKQEHTGEVELTHDSQLNTTLQSKLMTDTIKSIYDYCEFIQQRLEKIKEQRNTEQKGLENSETRIKEIEKQIADAEKRMEDIKKLIERTQLEYEKCNKKLSEVTHEQEALSKELDEKNQPVDLKTSSEIRKIKQYIKDTQDKLNICSNSCSNNDQIECKRKPEVATLQFFLKEKSEKESNIETYKKEINSLDDVSRVKELEEQINKEEQALTVLLEKIDNVQKNIKSIEEEQQASHDQQNQKQLDEELREINQLMERIYSYEQNIALTRTQWLRKIKTKNLKEQHIANLKKEEPDETEVETEEKHLKELNEAIKDIETTLGSISREKTLMCNNSPLLTKILSDPQYDIYEQQRNKQNRLTELTERSKQQHGIIERLQQSLLYEENRIKDQDREILNMKEKLNLQKTKHNVHKQNVQSSTELNELGTKLLQSLRDVEASLKSTLEKLNQILDAQKLIKEQMSLSAELILAINEQSRLDTLQKALTEQLYAKKNETYSYRFTTAQACQEQYDIISKDYDSECLQTKNLEQELSDMGVYSYLIDEITSLEREAQNKCHCGTDHVCSGICQICLKEDEKKRNKCMFPAGHDGDHICDAGHVCLKLCEICKKYESSNKRCVFKYEHTEPTYHRCERTTHQCTKTCFCNNLCVIPQELEQHDFHRCDKQDCWQPCMFSCGKSCVTQDHNHDATAKTVPIAIGSDIHQKKKHLCNQPHSCMGVCKKPGVCKHEYLDILTEWKTESGISFPYIYVQVTAVRETCKENIDVGKTSHDESRFLLCDCKKKHTCPEKCPDCGSFCTNSTGHIGNHKTNHRNKDQQIFTSTKPTERIELLSTIQEKTYTRVYKVGESAAPETCGGSCKSRGRAHFHLIECPGGLDCGEKIFGNKVKHSNDTYYCESGKPSGKNYDQVLCSFYWSLNKWHSPVSDGDRNLVDSCNTYCNKHIERDENGNILKESMKGFCTLEAWHTGDHVLQCQNDHESLKMYQGVDVCFVIDATGSMGKYFGKMKQTITCIIEKTLELMKKLRKSSSDFRFAIVDYRDHPKEADYLFHTCDFTTDSLASAYVENLKSGEGGDFPEAVLDGLEAACTLKWRDKTDRLLFHILDAPPHGKTYHTQLKLDKWPDGCPCKKTAEHVLSLMKKKNIIYHVLPCSNHLNMMITEFKKYIDVKTLTFDDRITLEDVITAQVCQQLIDTEITLRKNDEGIDLYYILH